jgi:hypothetical protein
VVCQIIDIYTNICRKFIYNANLFKLIRWFILNTNPIIESIMDSEIMHGLDYKKSGYFGWSAKGEVTISSFIIIVASSICELFISILSILFLSPKFHPINKHLQSWKNIRHWIIFRFMPFDLIVFPRRIEKHIQSPLFINVWSLYWPIFQILLERIYSKYWFFNSKRLEQPLYLSLLT